MRPIAIAVALILAAAGASAATLFTATLNGQNNVPPIAAVTATGTGTFSLNDAQTELTYHIEYSGLTSAEIAAHFHVGGARQNGSPVLALPPGSPKDGVWAIPAEQVANLLDGRIYVNIHTETYATGEIRGNLTQVQVGTEDMSWGAVKARYR